MPAFRAILPQLDRNTIVFDRLWGATVRYDRAWMVAVFTGIKKDERRGASISFGAEARAV